MGPSSMDLRRRVAEAVENQEGSLRQLARRFCVSVTFITRLLGLRRQTGSLAPRPHGGGHRPALDEAGQQRLRQRLQEQPDLTLDELAQRLSCGRMAVWRTLRKLKITRKKKVCRADQRDRPDVQQKRQEFCAELADVDPEQLVFVDEMGATTAMARPYGRAPQGERVYGSVPGQWQSMTLISGMRLGGVVAPWAFPGATDTAGFQTYAEAILTPELREGDVVIWDNLKPHKDKGVVEAIERTGARVLPAPPWSPDLIPIEKMFSKVKGLLRSAAARASEALVEAMAQALDSVCSQDILGWFKSCGLAGGPDRPASAGRKGPLDRLQVEGLCATQT
jgi:transposase